MHQAAGARYFAQQLVAPSGEGHRPGARRRRSRALSLGDFRAKLAARTDLRPGLEPGYCDLVTGARQQNLS